MVRKNDQRLGCAAEGEKSFFYCFWCRFYLSKRSSNRKKTNEKRRAKLFYTFFFVFRISFSQHFNLIFNDVFVFVMSWKYIWYLSWRCFCKIWWSLLIRDVVSMFAMQMRWLDYVNHLSVWVLFSPFLWHDFSVKTTSSHTVWKWLKKYHFCNVVYFQVTNSNQTFLLIFHHFHHQDSWE